MSVELNDDIKMETTYCDECEYNPKSVVKDGFIIISGMNWCEHDKKIRPRENRLQVFFNSIRPCDKIYMKDLTTFEQYISLTNGKSPFINLVHMLTFNPNKPEYHNIKITRKGIKLGSVYGWEYDNQYDHIIYEFCDGRYHAAKSIFNRLRCFLDINLVPQFCKWCTDYCDNYKNAKHTRAQIEKLLKKPVKYVPIDEREISNDNKIFYAINKDFTWTEIVYALEKMDAYGIDFDEGLVYLKKQITSTRIRDKYFRIKLLDKIVSAVVKLIELEC